MRALTLPKEPWPRTLSSSNWDGSAFSQPSFTWWVIGISLYVPSSYTDNKRRLRCTTCCSRARSAVLTQCEKDSPSSMGSSMTWCPLICRHTRFHQKVSERASAATNLHHPSFLTEQDCDTGRCPPTHTALKLISQTKLVTCKKKKKKGFTFQLVSYGGPTVWNPYSKYIQLSSFHPPHIKPLIIIILS